MHCDCDQQCAACVLRAVLFGACKFATDTSVWPTAAFQFLLVSVTQHIQQI
jgi:hypothetical protein